MDSNRIIELIQNPEQILASDRVTIDQELLRYPYVPALHMLKLRWDHFYSQQEESQIVEKISIYVNTGKVIKEILTLDEKINSLQALIETDAKIDISQNPEHYSNDISEENQEPNFQLKNQLDVLQVENDQALEEPTIEDKQEEKFSFINKLGISHLFTSSDAEDFKGTIEVNVTDEIIPTTEKLQEEVPGDNDNLIQNEEELSVEENIQSVAVTVPEEVTSHSDLELSKSKEEIIEDKQETEDLTHEKPLKVEKLSFNEWLSLSSKRVSSEEETPPHEQKKQKEVIDKFIETNPKITVPKKETTIKQDISFKKEEIKDIANLMTITLAQLYVEQGKYDTAITAFKILSLKYPEKSSYFATEIKKIRKLKNSK